MGSQILMQIVKSLVAAMVAVLSPAKVREVLDKAFDAVEQKVQSTETQWDDVTVLPMLGALRAALNVPDNDEAESE